METTAISHIGQKAGGQASVLGWLYGKRSSGKIQFLIVRDGTGYLQVVVPKAEVAGSVWEAAEKAAQETSLAVTGTVREDKRAPGGYEMTATSVEILGPSENYPITPKEHGVDFLMSQRHLWMRSSKQHAVLRVRSELEQAIHDFFYKREYVRIDSPILTPAACEGTSTLFETQYTEDEKAYLSQSGQLYLEPAAAAFGKVYCFGPTFRAEKSKTRRHLREFWMVEPEVAFMEIDGLMNLAEEFVVEILKKKGFDVKFGDDFGGDEEGALASDFDRPIMITRYPASIKAFYMQPDPNDPEVVLGLDMIAPEGYGEIIGGSQRIHDHDLLLQRIKQHDLPIDAFQWYLDLRKYGTFPHAGFGMGLERVVAWISGVPHLRETIPYPRMLYRIYP